MSEITKSIITIAIYFAIIFITSSIGLPNWLCYIIWILAAGAWTIYISLNDAKAISIDKLKYDILAKLKQDGHECKMDEGYVVLVRNG